MSDLWNLIQSPVYKNDYEAVVKQWIFGHFVDENRTVPAERRGKVSSAYLKCEAPTLSYDFLKNCVLNPNYIDNLDTTEAIGLELCKWEYYIPNEDVFVYLLIEWYKFNKTITDDQGRLEKEIADLAHSVNWKAASDKAVNEFTEVVPSLANDVKSVHTGGNVNGYVPIEKTYDRI